jgi:hypothetical protein
MAAHDAEQRRRFDGARVVRHGIRPQRVDRDEQHEVRRAGGALQSPPRHGKQQRR